MADPMQGTLELQTDPGSVTRIVLNPNSADITAGGNGGGGDLILRNANDTEVVRLGHVQEIVADPQSPSPVVIADYTGLRIRSGSGLNLVQIGRMASSSSSTPANAPDDIGIIFGGQGFSARVRLIDKNNKTRLILGQDDQGHEARLVVFSANGKKLLEFDPDSAALYVGGEGNEGDVVVRDQDNKERIKLDGGEGDIRVRSAAGKNLLLFDSTYAALYVGGQGNEGDVVVRDQENRERIKLDGGEGDIWVRNAAGTELLRFDSTYAALYVGGQGNEGDVVVRDQNNKERIKLDGGSGDIILSNADCAEDFDVAATADAEPGTVMVLNERGELRTSSEPYDKRVAGVVSGAGDYRPGIVLDRQESGRSRAAIALVGKVYCKVDSRSGPIRVGDLLTTSSTPGHAMKASDPAQAFGAVIGKALRPLESGVGLIPILIALQ